MPAARPAPRLANGFSLIETLIALAIVAGLSSLALMSFGGSRDRLALRAEAVRVAAYFEQARALSLETARRVDVDFDPRRRVLTMRPEGELSASEALTLSFAEGGADAFVVSFFSDGGSSGGALVLRGKAGAYRVDIAWPTGRVTARQV